MTALLVAESCTLCGLCAFACPWRLISVPDGGVPRYTDTAGERCNLCGHCEAVCPTGAIYLDNPRLEPPRYGADGGAIEPERLASYLRMRRSIRSYRDEAVERATIAEMMDVVRYAPSGRNRQDVRWLIIHDTGELRRLTQIAMEWLRETGAAGTSFAARFDVPGMLRAWEHGRDPLTLHAPHLVLAHASPDNPVARTNATIALAHLDVVAPAFGAGTCWGGIFMLAVECCGELREALRLPAGEVAIHCLMLGYPALGYRRPPRRNPAAVAWR